MSEFLRYSDWLWGKLPNFASVLFFLLLWSRVSVFVGSVLFLELLVLLALLFSLAYAFNDYCDRVLDEAAGKPNCMRGKNAVWVLFFVSSVACLLFFFSGFAHFFPSVVFFSMFAAVWSYSVFGLRLKEKPFLGVFVSVLGQQVLPLLFLFSVFLGPAEAFLAFCVYFLFMGMRMILEHQAADFVFDEKTGVRTLGTFLGLERVSGLAGTFFSLETVGLFVLLAYLSLLDSAFFFLAFGFVSALLLLPSFRYYVVYYFPRFFMNIFLAFLLLLREPSFLPIVVLDLFLVASLGLRLFSFARRRGGGFVSPRGRV